MATDDPAESETVSPRGIDRQLQEARYLQDRKFWSKAKEQQLIVTIIGSFADACNAVHWLPKGILWSGAFNQTLVGLLGTISSSALLYNYLYPVKPVFKQKDV